MINPRQDISYSDLQQFFDAATLANTQHMFLQGNLGDPIYHPQFHDIAELFFDVKDLTVVTNGMHTAQFWTQLLETWPANSTVTLSIDGLQDTNAVYRKNSNWEKIAKLFDLIATVKRQCQIEWKFIVFEHNYHQVEQAQTIARNLGMDRFRIQKTRTLDPGLDIKEYHNPKWFSYQQFEYEDEISPFCLTGDMHYIDAFGSYYPCCWWADTNVEPGFWTPININGNTADMLQREFAGFSNCIHSYSAAPLVCKNFCRKVKHNSKDMVTPNTQLNRMVMKLK